MMRLNRSKIGAKGSILALQLAVLLNAYLVTGVDDGGNEGLEILQQVESRTPYVYLSQREYLVEPNGEFREVTTIYPVHQNVTTNTRAAALTAFTEQLKHKFVNNYTSTESTESQSVEGDDEEIGDQSPASSIRTQSFENPYAKYSYGINDEGQVETSGLASGTSASSTSPQNIQQILDNRQGFPAYDNNGGGFRLDNYNNQQQQQQAPTFNSKSYSTNNNYPASYNSASPYESNEQQNYYPGPSNFDWPNNNFDQGGFGLKGGSGWGDGGAGGGGGKGNFLSPFLAGIADVTGSVKQVKSQVAAQKAQTAFQVGEVVKNAGQAGAQAILNKGQTAAAVVGQTVQTAGNLLRSKGETATRVIQGTGQFASQAVQTAGNIGSSLLRAKGAVVGAALKKGTALGTVVLGATSQGLVAGTNIVRAKGDATANLIGKGGKLVSGVIGTKGRLASSIINAKGQLVAQIIDAKGRAAVTLLENSGQKLNELADAIRGASFKGPAVKGPGSNFGWSQNSASFATPPQPVLSLSTQAPIASIGPEEPVFIQPANQQQSLDYADTYYDPRDIYRSSTAPEEDVRSEEREQSDEKRGQEQSDERQQSDERDRERDDIDNDYASYYTPHRQRYYQHQPSATTNFYQTYKWP